MTKSLSDFWRVKKSYDKMVEMISLLGGLKSFIELAADEGDFNVSWADRSSHREGEDKKITLSYLPIKDLAAPFSGRTVDALVGQAAHEAGHRILYRKGSKIRQLSDYEMPSGMSRSFESAVSNILQDVYIDRYLFQYVPILKTYIRSGRDFDKETDDYKGKLEKLKNSVQIDRLDLFNLWILYELYDMNSAEELQGFPQPVLETLLNLAEITDEYCKRGGLVDAIAVYTAVWNEFLKYPNASEEGNARSKREKESDTGKEKNGTDKEEGGTGIDFGDNSSGNDSPSSDSPTDSIGDEQDDDEQDNDGQKDKPKDSKEENNFSDSPGTDSPIKDEKRDSLIDEDKGQGDGSEENDPIDDEVYTDISYGKILPCLDEESQLIPKELEKALKEAIRSEREDIAQELAEEFQQENILQPQHRHLAPLPVLVEKPSKSILLVSKQQDDITHSVNQIFDFRKQHLTRHSRGIEEGSLSQRRLHRAGYGNGHIYERRDIKDLLDIGICILVDASSSVTRDWGTIEQIIGSLASGLRHKKGVKLMVLAYNSGIGINIHRLYEHGNSELGTCCPSGGTPSITVIGAAPMLMKRLLGKTRDKLIIHITDGFPTDASITGTDLSNMVKIVEKKYGTEVYCFVISSSAKTAPTVDLRQAYGTSYTVLTSYKDLPEALKALLRDKLVTSA